MTAPISVQDLFNRIVPESLAKNLEKVRRIGAVLAFKITGDGGGEWTIDTVSATPSCTKGISRTPQCTIEITSEDFTSMLGNPALGMQLYFQGKLKVTGDPMLATKLQKLFSMGA